MPGNPDPSQVITYFFAKDGSLTVDPDITSDANTLVLQADVMRSYLMRAGIYIFGAVNIGVANDNGALLSGIEVYDTLIHSVFTVANPIIENNYVTLKIDVAPAATRYYGSGTLAQQRPSTVLGATLYPYIATDSDETGQAPGNSYITRYRNVFLCKNNALTLQSFVPYGSVTISINGGAATTINVDGNGDGTFDFNGQSFPCQISVSAFDSPNATGVRKGSFVVLDACGGDVIGGTRTTLQAYPFTPKSIPRITLWLKPEDIPVAGGSAMNTGWPDASGLARDLVKSASAAPVKIDNVINGLPVARFDGSGQLLYNDSDALRPPNFTIIAALQWQGHPALRGLLSIAQDGSQGININDNGGGGAEAIYGNDTNGGSYTPTTFGAGLTPHVLLIEVSSLTGRMRVFLNTPNIAVVDIARAIAWPSEDPAFSLGTFYCNVGGTGAALFGIGDIGEIVVYDKVLRPNDRTAIMNYFSHRWL